jgi:hypothetical protein
LAATSVQADRAAPRRALLSLTSRRREKILLGSSVGPNDLHRLRLTNIEIKHFRNVGAIVKLYVQFFVGQFWPQRDRTNTHRRSGSHHGFVDAPLIDEDSVF